MTPQITFKKQVVKFIIAVHVIILCRALSVNLQDDTLCPKEILTSYSKRDYLPEGSPHSSPIMLLTIAGSGNKLARSLLEYSTGIYTGSVHSNGEMKDIEQLCGRQRTSAIDAHPSHVFLMNNASSGAGFLSIRSVTESNQKMKRKCRGPTFDYDFSRVIIVVRDPYEAIWADYQLRDPHAHQKDRTGIVLEEFLRDQWVDDALSLSAYVSVFWTTIYQKIFHQFRIEDYMVVRYEDLIDPAVRLDALRHMLTFMEYDVDERRMRCAFALAAQSSSSSIDEGPGPGPEPGPEPDTTGAEERKQGRKRSADGSSSVLATVSAEAAFGNKRLVCTMWAAWRDTDMSNYGYGPYNGTECSSSAGRDKRHGKDKENDTENDNEQAIRKEMDEKDG